MILPDFKDFPRSGRVIGIDWGARRTGVAITDESRTFVFVRPVIVSNGMDDLIDKLVKIISSEKIVGVVVGLPLRMDGSESDTTKKVREFADVLAKKINEPVVMLDETLSSASAQDGMGRVRRVDIKEKLDSESARVILENALSIISRI
ncbi:MAG: Holliday junction resolvase RuvX [Alphaproteobacteria bacterium]|nr:Holliday junction resolvase RuvX [Alphaproteobacteria bacterium]